MGNVPRRRYKLAEMDMAKVELKVVSCVYNENDPDDLAIPGFLKRRYDFDSDYHKRWGVVK